MVCCDEREAVVSDYLEGEIEAAWAHAQLCSSLEGLKEFLEARRAMRGEKWKRGVTHLMGANTTTPDQIEAGRKVSHNYDKEIVEKMKEFDVVIWDGDYIHPTSFTRVLLSLTESDWDGIIIALRMHWTLEPWLEDAYWKLLHAKGAGKVFYIPIKSALLPGRQPWNQSTDKKGLAPWKDFSAVLNQINPDGFEYSGARHCLVLGGGYLTCQQMKAQLGRGVDMDVYAVARYQDNYAIWDGEGVLDWLYKAETQQESRGLKLEQDKEAFGVAGKVCTFMPRSLTGTISLHYCNDWWSVAGTAKAHRVADALEKGLTLEEAILEAEKPYLTKFGTQPRSEWGKAAPKLRELGTDFHQAVLIAKQLPSFRR